jgi:hypothetical protein
MAVNHTDGHASETNFKELNGIAFSVLIKIA